MLLQPYPGSQLVTAVVLQYAPAGQFVHAIDPVTAANVPALHVVHTAFDDAPVVVEYVPTGHAVHAALDVAPTRLVYVPVAHAVQTAFPVPSAYVPGTQFAHPLLFVPAFAWPEGHTVQAPAPYP